MPADIIHRPSSVISSSTIRLWNGKSPPNISSATSVDMPHITPIIWSTAYLQLSRLITYSCASACVILCLFSSRNTQLELVPSCKRFNLVHQLSHWIINSSCSPCDRYCVHWQYDKTLSLTCGLLVHTKVTKVNDPICREFEFRSKFKFRITLFSQTSILNMIPNPKLNIYAKNQTKMQVEIS